MEMSEFPQECAIQQVLNEKSVILRVPKTFLAALASGNHSAVTIEGFSFRFYSMAGDRSTVQRYTVLMNFCLPASYLQALQLAQILFALARGNAIIEQKLGNIMVRHLLELGCGSQSDTQVQHQNRGQRGGRAGRKDHRAHRPRQDKQETQGRQDRGPPNPNPQLKRQQAVNEGTAKFARPQETISTNSNTNTTHSGISTIPSLILPSSRDSYQSQPQKPAFSQQQFPQPPPYPYAGNVNPPYSQTYGQTHQSMMPTPSPHQSGFQRENLNRTSLFNSNPCSSIAQENTTSVSSGDGFHRPWNFQGLMSCASAENNLVTSNTSFQPFANNVFQPNKPPMSQVQASNNSTNFQTPFPQRTHVTACYSQSQPSQPMYPYAQNYSQMFQGQSAPTGLIHHRPNNETMYPNIMTPHHPPPPHPNPTPLHPPSYCPPPVYPYVSQPSSSFFSNEQITNSQQSQGPQYPYSGNYTTPLPRPTNSYSSAAENSTVIRHGPAYTENSFSDVPPNQYTNVNHGGNTMQCQDNTSQTTVENEGSMLGKLRRQWDQTNCYTYAYSGYESQPVHQVSDFNVNPSNLVNVPIDHSLNLQGPSVPSENNVCQTGITAQRNKLNQQGLSGNNTADEYQFAPISPDSDRLTNDSVIFCPNDLSAFLEAMPTPRIKIERQDEDDTLENLPDVAIDLPNEVLEFMKREINYSD